jgi:3-phosphoshikimate 1-carboxyvinyltransferase
MQVTIEPGNISGTISAPPSKSMTQRAYAAALLHKGKTIIHNAGRSEDEAAALGVIQQLGAKVVNQANNSIEIISDGVNPNASEINCGESGLAARLFTPIAALSDKTIQINGRGSLLQRPMEGFGEVLPALNASLKDFNGCVPFAVQGPMLATNITVDGKGGSQFLSGLLFALSSCATEPVIITVTELKSKPYIDMTLGMLAKFGKVIRHNDHKEFYIDPAQFVHKETVEINIEGDWSGAAYFLVAGSIAGDVTVRNLDVSSSQADRVVLDVLRSAGAGVTINEDSICVKKAQLNGFEFDATHCPDLFPVLAILAACCEGESYIGGVHRLFHKESNRAESISEMLQNFDVPFSLEDDVFCITGVRKLQGTVIDTYGDHRIVMAAAVGALRAGSRVDIHGAEAVKKSYPGFFEDLILLGGRCKLAT